MKKFRVNTKDVGCEDLLIIAKRLGFKVKQGRKHCKIETSEGKFVTEIPRHNPVKRETARGILEAMSEFGVKIDFT